MTPVLRKSRETNPRRDFSTKFYENLLVRNLLEVTCTHTHGHEFITSLSSEQVNVAVMLQKCLIGIFSGTLVLSWFSSGPPHKCRGIASGHDQFLSDPFSVIIHRSTLRGLSCWLRSKLNHREWVYLSLWNKSQVKMCNIGQVTRGLVVVRRADISAIYYPSQASSLYFV
jgi:hypothetical protein